MFDTVVIATDGSESAGRGVRAALDIATRFQSAVHVLYVVDTDEIERSPSEVHDEIEAASRQAGDEALAFAEENAEAFDISEIDTAIQHGDPATEIMAYADEVDADAIAVGTRGRHGEHAFLLGSVAEAVVRQAIQPVLTVRQLDGSS
jgi:nucleotide-binding universal stress UspA family protein